MPPPPGANRVKSTLTDLGFDMNMTILDYLRQRLQIISDNYPIELSYTIFHWLFLFQALLLYPLLILMCYFFCLFELDSVSKRSG